MNEFSEDRHAPWIAALLMIAAVNGWVLNRWVSKDTEPLGWDEAIHTEIAMEYRDRLLHDGATAVFKPALFNYPPLYHVFLAKSLSQAKDFADAGAVVNYGFFLILIGSVFLIASRLLGRWPGLTAAFLVSTYPIIADMLRASMIDLALTAWVSLAFLCLLYSDDFESLSWSLAFGVACGFGMLLKWSFWIYLLGPAAIGVFQSIRRGRCLNWLLVLVIALLISFPWYSQNLFPMLRRFAIVTHLPPAAGMAPHLTWLWYPFSFLEELDLMFLLFFIPGIVAVFWKPRLWPLLAWIGVSFALLNFIGNRNTRYAMPVLPAVAVLSVSWLPSFRKIPFIVMMSLTAVFFVFLHFLPGRIDFLSVGNVTVRMVDDKPPLPVDWKHSAIISRVQQLKTPARFARVITVANGLRFHGNTLNVSAKQWGVTDFVFRGPSKRRWTEFADFILLKTGDNGPDFAAGTINACAQVMVHPPAWFSKVFHEAGRWPLPDNGEAILYQCKPDPVRGRSDELVHLELKVFEMPNVHAENVKIRALPLSASDSAVGRYKELIFECQTLAYKTLTLENVKLRLENPQIDLPLYLETQQIELLRLDALYPEANFQLSQLVQLAAKKLSWLDQPSATFTDGKLLLKGKVHEFPCELQESIWIKDERLKTHLDSIRFASFPIPKIFFRALTDQDVSLRPNADMPFKLGIKSVTGNGATMRIEALD